MEETTHAIGLVQSIIQVNCLETNLDRIEKISSETLLCHRFVSEI